MRSHLCFTRTIQTRLSWDRAKSQGGSNNGKCVTVRKRFKWLFWNQTHAQKPTLRDTCICCFLSWLEARLMRTTCLGKPWQWKHGGRIMSAMCAVSGSFTWRFLDHVGLAMMDIVLVIQTLLNCVRACVCVCVSQKDVHNRGVFMRRSGSGWIPQISDMASH